MSINEALTDSILNQFAVNSRVNLFYENIDFQNHFLDETRNVIHKFKEELLKMDDENLSHYWVQLMTEKALTTFCSTNQYLDTRKKNVAALQQLYRILWDEIIEELRTGHVDFDFLQKSHLRRLKNWLSLTNGFVKELNGTSSLHVKDVPCSEYSAGFQLNLMDIDLQSIIQPVLDIGCGKNANLVNYMRSNGVDAFGIDRLVQWNDYLYRVDWLDYDFQPNTWGTIISNLSFALHFTNHHHRKNGEYILYARKYMEILNSLKISGVFYYAPGLPFIEAHLPKDKFKTFTHRINEDFSYSKITRI